MHLLIHISQQIPETILGNKIFERNVVKNVFEFGKRATKTKLMQGPQPVVQRKAVQGPQPVVQRKAVQRKAVQGPQPVVQRKAGGHGPVAPPPPSIQGPVAAAEPSKLVGPGRGGNGHATRKVYLPKVKYLLASRRLISCESLR
jgi:hypothetical protein